MDPHPDGKRVVMLEIVDDEKREPTEVILVQNFVAELEGLALVKD